MLGELTEEKKKALTKTIESCHSNIRFHFSSLCQEKNTSNLIHVLILFALQKFNFIVEAIK